MFDKLFDLFQLTIILFFLSLLCAFIISNIFSQIDKEIDKITDTGTKDFLRFLVTIVQLFLTAIAYFMIDMILERLHPWHDMVRTIFFDTRRKRGQLPRTLKSTEVVNYGIHIVLIITLIEMNKSLKYNFHEISEIVVI